MKTRKWADVRDARLSPEARKRVNRKVEAELLEMSLAELRKELGITQVEMASAADMTQAQISTWERRDDHLVSTLRRCVRALGGELEVVAVVGDKRVKLNV